MAAFILANFRGATIRVFLTGGFTVTGEVFDGDLTTNIIGLRLTGGLKVYINALQIVAFF